MNFVLGLSVTSAGTCAVLVEGARGEGATIHKFATERADGLVPALTEDPVIGPALDSGLPAIGITCSHAAGGEAGTVVDELVAHGYPNVFAVSELDAADALATGIADLAGDANIAVCIIEPDDAIIAIAGRDGVTIDGVERFSADDAAGVADSLVTRLRIAGAPPESIYVVGAADDVAEVTSALDDRTDLPVVSAQEGALALARGAALAAARAARPSGTRRIPLMPAFLSNVGALSSVLIVATLVFVVSLSVAVGLRLSPQKTPEQRQTASTVDESAATVSTPTVAQAAPAPPRPEAPPVAPPPEVAEVLPHAETIAAAPPPAPEVVPAESQWQAAAAGAPAPPVAEAPMPPPAAPPPPPPAHVPPEPAYAPPPAPEYVPPAPPAFAPPPANPAPEPRLRDRIIEHIPIINRFHEPQLQYPR